jgi:flagellar secretion chaperone FliS
MSFNAHTSYRETEVLTAPPQRLRLMLIQAALRSIERTRQQWRAGADEQALDALIHAQEVVTELLSGINTAINQEVTRKVAAIYVFVFRTLVEAGFSRSEGKLDEAQRVLLEEQETWRQMCEHLDDTGHDGAHLTLRGPAGSAPADIPLPPLDLDLPGEPSAGFSLEA